MVAGARSQVDGQSLGVRVSGCLFRASVDVGSWEGVIVRGVCDSVHVVLNLLDGRLRTPTFLNDRILIGVLGRIRVDQRSAVNGTVSGVLVPVVVGVQTRVNQELEDLVGGGVGPLLPRERYHAGRERCRHG